jgi:MFS family permease
MSSFEQVSVGVEDQRIWNPAFISIFISNMLMHLGQQMMNTLVTKYAYSMGASATIVGMVASMFAYTAILFKIFSAPAIDTFNKKYIMTGSILVVALSYAGYGLSTSVPMLMGFRLLQGAGQAFTATTALAMASTTLPSNKLGTGIGYFSLAQAICQAIGPTVGLGLVSVIGYNKTFMVGAATMVFAATAASKIKISHTRTQKFTISTKNFIAKEALLPAGIMFFLTGVYSNINAFLVIYATERGAGAHIGYFFTVYAVALLFTRPTIGKMSDKYGLVKVIIPALGCFGLAFWIISYAHSIPMFLLAALVSAFGYGACQPAVQTLSMKCVPKERWGAASSTNYLGQDLGQLVGPVVAGMAIEQTSFSTMWQLMTIPVLMALVIVWINAKKISSYYVLKTEPVNIEPVNE